MATLLTENRRLLERTIVDARALAERAARAALDALAVGRAKPDAYMSEEQKAVRNHLRARARHLGDKRHANDTHETEHLVRECAYEQWHRMLFARFLAENNLLIEPDAGVAISLDECKELAKEEKTDLWTLAGRYAQRMLPQIFRADDPVLKVRLAREHELKLEGFVDGLPTAVFMATDSLGWCYQFWQTDEKKRVNESENKIGADELPAVTQLFTEDYMVDFLLDNTLGAWWVGRQMERDSKLFAGAKTEEECRRRVALPDCEWNSLRFIRDERGDWLPASGTFDGWPKKAKDLKCMDPSCGSGHFLVAIFLRLAALRLAQERAKKHAIACAVIEDNVAGLEIDPRCTQMGAFSLALAAWRFGGYGVLPEMQVACCGLSPQATLAEWVALAGETEKLQRGMKRLHRLFQLAPTVGSLISPRVRGDLLMADYADLAPLLKTAMEQSETQVGTLEMAVTAQGIAAAARLLAEKYTLIATNFPYLKRGNQCDELKQFCSEIDPAAHAELATTFLVKVLGDLEGSGVVAVVTPQSLTYQRYYIRLRKQLLEENVLHVSAKLGPHAFETISGEIVQPVLLIAGNGAPAVDHAVSYLDVVRLRTPNEKAVALRSLDILRLNQRTLATGREHKIVSAEDNGLPDLAEFADCYQGICTGDMLKFGRLFWELPVLGDGWVLQNSTPEDSRLVSGCTNALLWENGCGTLYDQVVDRLGEASVSSWIRGTEAWGSLGVAIAQMRSLRAGLYLGTCFDNNTAVIIPKDRDHYTAILAFCRSDEYRDAVLEIDQSIKLSNKTLLKVPFDMERWREVARQQWTEGPPAPSSEDPDEWVFAGSPKGSRHPMQVAVARLLGYQWPRQAGARLADCASVVPDGLGKLADDDGIVCIPSVRGETGAADRLLGLLSAAGVKATRDLDDWLRNVFFEEHCKLFRDRPFVWHIWDGRKRDGFHALVNYHMLADGVKGRRLLEKLTHAYLGDWLTRQRAEVKDGKEGADARLAAALALKERLEAIIEGKPPYDLFVRWKPLAKQPIGWEPDINDGVRMNIRPFMASDLPGGKKGAGVLRVAPKIKWTKDRGKEPDRAKDEYPWFWSWDEKAQDFMGGKAFDGNRWNDCHYSNDVKRKARG